MKASTLLLFAIFHFPLAAFAQAYGSAAAGITHNELECGSSPTCDESGTGFKLLAGYRFTPLIAAELTYFDFGKSRLGDPFFTQDFHVTAFAAGAALHGDFTQSWSWVARAGVARVRVAVKSVAGALGNNQSDTRTAPYFGVGVGYRFTRQLSADASFDTTEAVFDLNNNNRREWNPRALWLGATYAF